MKKYLVILLFSFLFFGYAKAETTEFLNHPYYSQADLYFKLENAKEEKTNTYLTEYNSPVYDVAVFGNGFYKDVNKTTYLATTTNFDFNSDNITISFWAIKTCTWLANDQKNYFILRTNKNNTSVLFAISQVNNNGFPTLSFTRNPNGGTAKSTSGYYQPATNTPFMITATYSSSTLLHKLYVNGEVFSVSRHIYSSPTSSSTPLIQISSATAADSCFKIDDLILFKKALSSYEVLQLYNYQQYITSTSTSNQMTTIATSTLITGQYLGGDDIGKISSISGTDINGITYTIYNYPFILFVFVFIILIFSVITTALFIHFKTKK